MKKFTILFLTLAVIMSMSINSEPKKRFLVEEHTGAWCPPCGSVGKPTMEALIDKYPDVVIPVELHNASPGRVDPMAIPEQQTVAGALGLPGFPYGSIDRMMFNDGTNNVIFLYPTTWDGVIAQLNTGAAPVVDVQLFYSVNRSTRKLSATIEANFLQSYTPAANGELRFNVYVLENNIIYNQAGNIQNFSHQNVCSVMLGGAWGTSGIIPSSVNAGSSYTTTYEVTLNSAWNLDNLHFVGLVQEYHAQYADVKKILNSVVGAEGTPYSELSYTGSVLSVVPSGETYSKVMTLKNPTGSKLTYRITGEFSDRTPADWTYDVIVPSSSIEAKGEKTQAKEISLNAGASADITVQLTPGATIGAGDITVEVMNKSDLGGQRSRATISAVSEETSALQITEYGDAGLSLKSQMTNAGLNNIIEISGAEFELIGDAMPNLKTLVWNCGEEGELSSSSSSAISSAITNGVNTMITGGKMGTSVGTKAPGLLSYLGIQFIKLCNKGAGTGNVTFVGYQGDPISNGFDQPAKIKYYTPALRITGSDTYPILKHKNTDTVLAVRSVIGETKVVFIGTNLFAITNQSGRNNFIEKCFNWLGGAGPSISCVDELSFDDTDVGSTSEMTVTIENKGNSPLNVTEVEVDPEYLSNFFVNGNNSFTVAANSTYDLVLQFKPTYAMDYTSWVKIHSDAENAPEKLIDITGTGIAAAPAPSISLNKTEITFAEADINEAVTQELEIENIGTAELNITNITVPAAQSAVFTISPTTLSVAQEEKQTVTITFQSNEPGTFECNMTIVSNNKNGAVRIPLSASAVVGVEDNNNSSEVLSIKAGPNPFAGSTNIDFTLKGSMSREVEITAIDASGRKVKNIANKMYEPGTYKLEFDGSDLSSGTYYIVAKVNGYSAQLQVAIVK